MISWRDICAYARDADDRYIPAAPHVDARVHDEAERLIGKFIKRTTSREMREHAWNGKDLHSTSDALVDLHELAHWLVCDPIRRAVPDFGLGPGFQSKAADGYSRARTTDDSTGCVVRVMTACGEAWFTKESAGTIALLQISKCRLMS